MRSWVDTIFTPQGALDTFLFQKQTKSVILLIKLTPHLPHKVPSHSFNSDTQNVNTKDILGGHHIHPSSCPCYLSLVVLIRGCPHITSAAGGGGGGPANADDCGGGGEGG